MTDRERNELQKVIAAMSLSDLTLAKQMLSKELNQRHGKDKFRPVKWDAPMSTR